LPGLIDAFARWTLHQGLSVMDFRAALGDAILSSESDAIIATGKDGAISFWNPGAARIFGFTENEAVGQSLDIIIPENLRARHWEGYDKVMESGQSRYSHGDLLAVPALTKAGTRISVEFTMVVLPGPDGKPAGTAAVLRDVTKKFEENRALRKKLAAAQNAAKENI
jgi:PAS domain S-box-containing protein